MKIAADHFRNAVKDLAGMISGRTTLPVLGCIRLQSSPGALQLTATDLDQWLRLTIPAEGDTFDPVCVPAKALMNVATTAAGSLVLTGSRSALHAVSGFKAKLSVIDAAEFPTDPDVAKSDPVEIPDFAARLDKVKHSMSVDDGRPNLACLHIAYRAGQSVIESTDMRRLACHRLDADAHPEFCIPTAAVKTACKWAGYATRIAKSESHLTMSGDLGGMEFSSHLRLSDLSYPNAQAVLNMETETLGRVQTPDFLAAVQAAGRFADENDLIDINYGPEGIEVIAVGPQGEFRNRIEGKFETSAHRMDYKYLAEALSQCRVEVDLKHSPPPATRLDLLDGPLTQLVMGARKG